MRGEDVQKFPHQKVDRWSGGLGPNKRLLVGSQFAAAAGPFPSSGAEVPAALRKGLTETPSDLELSCTRGETCGARTAWGLMVTRSRLAGGSLSGIVRPPLADSKNTPNLKPRIKN